MDVCGTLSFTSLYQNNRRLCCKFNQHEMLVVHQGIEQGIDYFL